MCLERQRLSIVISKQQSKGCLSRSSEVCYVGVITIKAASEVVNGALTMASNARGVYTKLKWPSVISKYALFHGKQVVQISLCIR